MSEDLKTLNLTQRQIDLVLECIGTNIETVKRRHPMTGMAADLVQELAEMDMDIREEAFRDERWDDAEPTEIAETQMFNAGVEARENAKASSRACSERCFSNSF